jgi:NADH:ubiquinone oxidoreductase subunit E
METRATNSKENRFPAITVCVGSACHLRGSYEIIEFLKEELKKHQLENRIVLKGCFCMERCTEGVNVKIGKEVFSVTSVDRMREIFDEKIFKQEGNPGEAENGQEKVSMPT